MKSIFSKILWGLGLFITAVIGLSLLYYLPSTKKVELVGTEVKRMEIAQSTGDRTRDVRYIVTRDKYSGKTLMFRNEDMGWPPHFKFNSGNLAGNVMNLKESHPQATVLITYYGWRIPLLSSYPNVTDLKIVDDEYSHIPWFNLIFLAGLFIFGLFLYIRIKRYFGKKTLDNK